jgi:hypothetical protein
MFERLVSWKVISRYFKEDGRLFKFRYLAFSIRLYIGPRILETNISA